MRGCVSSNHEAIHVTSHLSFAVPTDTAFQHQVLTYRGCLYNEAHFSQGLGYFVVDCKGPDVPKVRLYNGVTLREESRRHSTLN